MRRHALSIPCLAALSLLVLATGHPHAGGAPPPPARIVSTSPSITETLFALGLGERVVGVSRYCRYPEAATRKPQIGTFLKPDAELIARLRPDLVIVHKSPGGLERKLTGLRMPFITVERGTLASIDTSIRAIGRAAGVPERADALTRDLHGQLDTIRARVAGRPRQKVLLIVGRRTGMLADLVAVGRDSYLNDLVTIAGGTNVLADGALPDYPRISMETVIRLAPDVIVDAADMGDTPAELARRKTVVEAMWQRSSLPAARAGRVHAAASDAFVVPGPRVVEATAALAKWIHGVSADASSAPDAEKGMAGAVGQTPHPPGEKAALP